MRRLILMLLLMAWLVPTSLWSQSPASPLVMPRKQFFDAVGNPLAGGHICTYLVGSSTPQVTYTDFTATVTNALCDPVPNVIGGAHGIVLDAGGYASIYMKCADPPYKIIVYDQNGVLQWTEDGVQYPGCGPNALPGAHNLLYAPMHLDTVTHTPPVLGDLIYANSTPKWTALARGTASQLLTMDPAGTNIPSWQTFKFYQNSTTPVNAVGRLGLNLVAGTNITITPADDPANNRVSYTITGTGGTGLPDKFYMLLPDCSNTVYVGIEDITPIESYFAKTFSNFGAAAVGQSNCFVTYGTDTGVDQFAEVKEASGFLRDQYPWTLKVYIKLNNLTKERIWFGFTDSLSVNWATSDNPSAFASDVAMVRFSTTGDAPDAGAGDTTLHFVTMFNGAAATIHDTTVAPDTNTHKFEFSYNGTNAVTLKMDGTTIDTATGTYTDGFPLFWYISITSLDAAASKSFSFYGLQLIEQNIKTGP